MSAILLRARETLLAEIEGIQSLVERLDDLFEKAVDLLFTCRGNVICLGMGKSGIIGQKMAATLTSTGTPAIFLHPCRMLPWGPGVDHQKGHGFSHFQQW